MANTRQSGKRARRAIKQQTRNTLVKSATKTAVKAAVEAISKKDLKQAKDLYTKAIRSLSKAASKGVLPKGRAARKTSRLTSFIKKHLPEAVK